MPEYDENASIHYKGKDIEGEPDYPIEFFEFVKKIKKQKRGFEKISTSPNAKLPQRSTSRSAGYDFFSNEDGVVPAGQRKLFRTGIKAYMMKNEVLLCFPRSSLGIKNGIRLTNGTGVIDSDYYNNPENEGEIHVSLHNTSENDFEVKKGDRIFQAVFTKYLIADNDIPISKKRRGGIGSTGK
ncbi:MAG: dUTP diphosphatase [Candidatus Moranbacteria bacterium]|nr:dUTP diphosphatase [Candidatus Moranbacteria bacterium]